MTSDAKGFYGSDQAWVHDTRFGDLATDAAAMVVARLHDAGMGRGHVTDLGCGSGILAAQLVNDGFTVTGVDLSPAMIELARRRVPSATFTVGSVHDMVIPPSVAVTATGEVLQYAADARAGLDAFADVARRVAEALAPGGVFALDLSTPGRNLGHEVRHVFHDHGAWMLGMHASESADGTRLDRRIVVLMREDDGRYRRVDEHHTLVLFDVAAVAGILRNTGLVVEVRSAYTRSTASTPEAGWAVFVGTKR